jgi:hypothetical protein
MLRVRRIVGTFAPWMMMGVWACGGSERNFVDKNGNETDAATTSDVVTIDTASPPDAGADSKDADASTPDVVNDVTADVSGDRRTDATTDVATLDVKATSDGSADAAADTSDAATSDAASNDAPTAIDADAAPEAAPPCSPIGGFRCSDVNLQQCTETGWENRLRCASPALCDAVGGACNTPVCQPNTYR